MEKGRKPKNKPLFENDEYSITEIPLNYAINVKIMKRANKSGKMIKLIPE